MGKIRQTQERTRDLAREFTLVKKLRQSRLNHKQRSKLVRGLTIIGGGLLVGVGLLLLALPGPAFAVIPLGLYLLALEFHWAERLLQRALEHAARAKESSFAQAIGGFIKRHPRLSALLLAVFLTLVAAFVASLFAFDLIPEHWF